MQKMFKYCRKKVMVHIHFPQYCFITVVKENEKNDPSKKMSNFMKINFKSSYKLCRKISSFEQWTIV